MQHNGGMKTDALPQVRIEPQMEFEAQADSAWSRFQTTGAGLPAEEVVAEMRVRLEARRRELQSKHRPPEA